VFSPTAHQDLSSHSYAIVIDAGSSSSKVHLFHWPPHNGDPQSLLDINPLTDEYGDPLNKKVEPGKRTRTSVYMTCTIHMVLGDLGRKMDLVEILYVDSTH